MVPENSGMHRNEQSGHSAQGALSCMGLSPPGTCNYGSQCTACLTRLNAAQSLSIAASLTSICSSLTALLATSSTSSLHRPHRGVKNRSSHR